MDGLILQLPLELRQDIAAKSAGACFGAWLCDSAFRLEFDPRSYIELFVVREDDRTILFGLLHSIDDQPSLIERTYMGRQDGMVVKETWHYRGRLHREIHPAMMMRGHKKWYRHGFLHRGDDLPAVENPNGSRHWYLNDKLCRPSGGPTIIRSNGTQIWKNIAEKYHRVDGPAVVHPSGLTEYWINGTQS